MHLKEVYGKLIQLKKNKEIYETIDDIFENIENINIIDLIHKSEIIYQSKNDIWDILDYINVILYYKMQLNTVMYKKYVNSIEIVEKTKEKLKSNTNYDMCIDFLLFKLWEELNK